MLSPDPGSLSMIDRSGLRALLLFYIASSQEGTLLSATIVILDIGKALVNQCNKGKQFNRWIPNTRGITNCLYLDLSLYLSWFIHIMYIFYLGQKANVLEAAVFQDNIFLYVFIAFIDFLAIKSLLISILLSY